MIILTNRGICYSIFDFLSLLGVTSFIWRLVVTCKSLGSGSPSFGGQRLSLSHLGVTPLHLEAGSYL